MFYLDVTRILGRVNSPSPTGIDRVELEYAKFACGNGMHFVSQFGNSVVQVPFLLANEVVSFLDSRWNGEDLNGDLVEKHVKEWRKGVRLPSKDSKLFTFFQSLKKEKIVQRISMLWREREYISKKVPFIPSAIAVCAVALWPSLFEKLLKIKKKVPVPTFIVDPAHKEFFYLNVGHTGLEKINLLPMLNKVKGMKTAIYIHDVLPVSHPWLFVKGEKDKHIVRMNNVIKSADLIFVNSRFTQVELEKIFKTNKIKGVLEIGTPEATPGREPLPYNGRTGFVSIGTIEPRKNYLWLVQAWLSFCEQNKELTENEKFTIFGKSGWLNGKDMEKLHRLASESGRVEIISGAGDKVLAERLASARAYVTAAEVEGWGMPLAESLALGTPVIATDVPAHREVTQGTARYFEFDNEAEFHRLLAACFDSAQVKQMQTEAASFVPWKWKSHFDKLMRAIGEEA